MIPKIIHYCWFGRKPLSDKALMCIESWKTICPDFEIKKWDEDNYELNNNFTKQAYNYKNFAFVADYCRLDVLSKEGGIYLDIDMLILKSLNNLLRNTCFFGFENDWTVSCGIIGAVPHHYFIEEIRSFYENIEFSITERLTITKHISDLILKNISGVSSMAQIFKDIVIYPTHYFYPMPSGLNDYTKFIKSESYTVHLWDFSWQDEFYLLQQGRIKDATKLLFRNKFLNINNIEKYYLHLFRSYPKSMKKWIKIKLNVINQQKK